MMRFWSVCVAAAAVTVVALSVGGGQEVQAQGNLRGPAVDMILTEEELTGREHKPEAFYILQHASLNYERLGARSTFIPELVGSVEAEAFKAEP